MSKRVWIVEGLGTENPVKYEIGPKERVSDLIRTYAKKLGVSQSEIEVTTDTTRLTDTDALLKDLVDSDETLNIIPRAKSGGW